MPKRNFIKKFKFKRFFRIFIDKINLYLKNDKNNCIITYYYLNSWPSLLFN